MKRSLINLDTEDQDWLRKKSSESGKSMAQIVRVAVKMLRDTDDKSFEALLSETSGTWAQGDGLDYQQRIRQEWD